MNVPEIIFQQLGGRRFVAATGSRNFTGYNDGLTMTLVKNASGANRLAITLTPNDTYNALLRVFTHTWHYQRNRRVRRRLLRRTAGLVRTGNRL